MFEIWKLSLLTQKKALSKAGRVYKGLFFHANIKQVLVKCFDPALIEQHYLPPSAHNA